MDLSVGLGACGVVFAGVGWLSARSARPMPGIIAYLSVSSGTNIVLLDRDAPFDQRWLPSMVAGVAAYVVVAAWEFGKNARTDQPPDATR
jgi:uncharacterized membrane protein SirB2